MLEYYLKLDFAQLILSQERELTESELEKLKKALELRKNNVPLQYILGSWSFMNLDFKVGSGVLIPREDTAALVNIVLPRLNSVAKPKILDLCSGSGAVAITIEKNAPEAQVYALERSDDALKYLRKNVKNLKSNVKVIKGDVFKDYEKFEESYFDFIVSNPPYIKTDDINRLEKEVLKEPKMALDGGKDGLDFYKAICKYWHSKLKIGGCLAFEIGIGMFEDVKNIMTDSGFTDIEFMKDINEIIRSVIGIKR